MRDPRYADRGRGPDLLNAPRLAAPATSLTSYVVHARHAAAFDAWADRIDAAAAKQPGFIQAVRLDQEGGVTHLLHAFERSADRDAWQDGATRQALAVEGERLAVSRRQNADGRRATIALPGDASGAKWKRFVMTWAAVFPTLLALNGLVGLLPVTLPSVARLAITSPLLTAALQWIILPRVTRWAKPWVLADKDGRPAKPEG